jgi:hypothetical protein
VRPWPRDCTSVIGTKSSGAHSCVMRVPIQLAIAKLVNPRMATIRAQQIDCSKHYADQRKRRVDEQDAADLLGSELTDDGQEVRHQHGCWTGS